MKETSWANARVKLHSQVHFESKKILGPKKCWVKKISFQKNFGSCHNLTCPDLTCPVLTCPVLT